MHFTCKLWPCQAKKKLLSNKAPTLFSSDDLNKHVYIKILVLPKVVENFIRI